MSYQLHGPRSAPDQKPVLRDEDCLILGPLTAADETDFEGDARDVLFPSLHPPGSPGRVEDMARRYGRRENLFCAKDAPEEEGDCYEAAQQGGDFYRLALLFRSHRGVEEVERRQELGRYRAVRPSDARTDGARAADAARKRAARKRRAEEKALRADVLSLPRALPRAA